MRSTVLSLSSRAARGRVAALLAACVSLSFPLASVAAESELTVLHHFSEDGTRRSGGAVPYSGLVQGPGGRFYGVASLGGSNGMGTIYGSRADGRTATLHSFNGTDGSQPGARLVVGPGGLYGSASAGGSCSFCGTLFKIDKEGRFTLLRNLRYNREGAQPNALMLASDGNFYGSTAFGGTGGGGTLFRMAPDGTVTVLHNFSNTVGDSPNSPAGPLLEGADGALYGTSVSGGSGGSGTVYRYGQDGVVTVLHAFSTLLIGYAPSTGVLQAADGTLYGLTSAGGIGNAGTMFKLNTDGSGFARLFAFPQGSISLGGLTQGADGNFYGTNFGGGTFGSGSVFRISPAGDYRLVYSFNSTGNEGTSPGSQVLFASDGGLYATASAGGTTGAGTLFRVDEAVPPVGR